MLAVPYRRKVFLILFLVVVIIILLLLFVGLQNDKKVPSRGVFVLADTLR
mgnify:CR=1 FL=1